MSIYQEILDWSQNKPLFIKDALRRIITQSNLTDTDIDELTLLVKKECGDTTINLNAIEFNSSHFPAITSPNSTYPKLFRLSNPNNICALDNQANLEFAPDGLTIVYGNNGSGKSSYVRILRKLCWSRNSSIELKNNIFNPSNNIQKVDLTLKHNNSDIQYNWVDGNTAHTHPLLNSIFVFDSDCGNIYINDENPNEYKPVGIDVLEKLIDTFKQMNEKIENSIASYHTQKPSLSNELLRTEVSQWYNSMENLSRLEIKSYIEWTQENINRKNNLTTLLHEQNPNEKIQNLNAQKRRYSLHIEHLKRIEDLFNEDNVGHIQQIKNAFASVSQAYFLASQKLSSVNTLDGFGTNPWRTLWDSAQKYAHHSHLSDGHNFPSLLSAQKCVLCQQELDEVAKRRLEVFNEFVLNDVSQQLDVITKTINNSKNSYSSIQFPSLEELSELLHHIPNFEDIYNEFLQSIMDCKRNIIAFLNNEMEELVCNPKKITQYIQISILDIDKQIGENTQLAKNRQKLSDELNELVAKEFLFNNKEKVIQYFDEYQSKTWLKLCQSKLNTTMISRKIGEIIVDQSVALQHEEFIKHLGSFNQDLASKIKIAKTKTTRGNTYQQCQLNVNGSNQKMNTILSEGEQRVVALANFLAECTIDNRQNTIIFDDPVTSLDMNYRDLIADKIIELSINRQIIVFTHDLSFLRLLIDVHKSKRSIDCHIASIDKYDGVSGIVTDEIPYLAKNVQQRIDSIITILDEYKAISPNKQSDREMKLDSARKRFRMLLERTVEEILSGKTYERFSKNIAFKRGNLSSYIVTEKADIDFLLGLFGKYSITEHDGGISTISQLPNETEIRNDLKDYKDWKDSFASRLKTFKKDNNYG
ncbi:AAA family ATPase [Moraxella sp. ZY210820]|uniref:AAA family ATPase n=1 Tax=unclassified Moraxella TaxID=2685852 RepID=UPI00272FC051|nr:AAA family ATPase [Moraxella sp. ZY210820]WLF84612.1 AAA family ATPase [Moraxella sp. ZY210820]